MAPRPHFESYSAKNRKAWMAARLQEDRAELRAARQRAGESNSQHKEPVKLVDNTQERAAHNGQLPGPSVCIRATPTLEEYSCGCVWYETDDGGLWQPCEHAKAMRQEHCR